MNNIHQNFEKYYELIAVYENKYLVHKIFPVFELKEYILIIVNTKNILVNSFYKNAKFSAFF